MNSTYNYIPYKQYIVQHIQQSLQEDLGDGDHTSLACIHPDNKSKAKLLVKEPGIIAGVDFTKIFVAEFAHELTLDTHIMDGTHVKPGDIVFYLEGSSLKILQIERVLLNYLQRMSGIATVTNKYSEKIKKYKAKVLDTRKTTPTLRIFEKWAVYIGGGNNHRFGLYDMVMIKDNHIDYAGGILNAIEKTHEYLKKNNKTLKIEIEVRNFNELEQVLSIGGIHRIMLDNFSVSDTIQAVSLINNRFEIESSGGITLDNIEEYAACGVDYISVGALTHHIQSLDLSLKAVL